MFTRSLSTATAILLGLVAVATVLLASPSDAESTGKHQKKHKPHTRSAKKRGKGTPHAPNARANKSANMSGETKQILAKAGFVGTSAAYALEFYNTQDMASFYHAFGETRVSSQALHEHLARLAKQNLTIETSLHTNPNIQSAQKTPFHHSPHELSEVFFTQHGKFLVGNLCFTIKKPELNVFTTHASVSDVSDILGDFYYPVEKAVSNPERDKELSRLQYDLQDDLRNVDIERSAEIITAGEAARKKTEIRENYRMATLSAPPALTFVPGQVMHQGLLHTIFSDDLLRKNMSVLRVLIMGYDTDQFGVDRKSIKYSGIIDMTTCKRIDNWQKISVANFVYQEFSSYELQFGTYNLTNLFNH